MTPEEAREALERCGAMLNGHFLLSSGRHSDRYVQKARVLERPALTMQMAGEIASWYSKIDVVVAPAVGAISLGFAVALLAGARSVFAERQEGRMTLRRGFTIARGERTLVVEDVVSTGGSAGEVYELAGRLQAERLGVAALVDRSSGELSLPLRSVARVDATSWDASECPLCAAGRPLDAPGSRRLQGTTRLG
ncbi:orotate phosphoribosyltransferase [soil metagenome]